jgi:Domain of unknown function (DUF4832)/Domain of unknown function (DUF4874)
MVKTAIKITIIIGLIFSGLSFFSSIYNSKALAIASNVVTYFEDTSNTANPERGFYRNYYGDPILSELATYKANKTTMYRTIYDISAFKNAPLSDSFLSQINQDASGFRQAGSKIMPNFKYSDGDTTPNDATKQVILGHLEQLRPYLNNNKDVIALLPSGFVGDYGEFTISDNDNISFVANEPYIASGNPTLADLANGAGRFVVNQNTQDIVNKILDVLPKERAFTIRQPATKKQLVNSLDPLTPQEAFGQSKKARLGHQNDSLLGNPLEGATFIYSQDDNSPGRNIEENYYNQDAQFVPHIAEAEFFDNGVSGQCVSALKLIKNRHLSSINETFNINTLNIWKNQGCYDEIAKKLGYRFVLNNSEVDPVAIKGASFNLKINLKNDGYAAPFNERKLEIILRNKLTGINFPIDVTSQSDPRLWYGQSPSIDLNLTANTSSVPAGEYDILLNLPDATPSLNSNPDYSIRLSNQNTWEPNTGYNKLNQTLKVVLSNTLASSSSSSISSMYLSSSLISSSSSVSSQSNSSSLNATLSNGISTEIERLSPNNGDANGDGQQDWQQINVAAIPNAVDGQYVIVFANNSSPCQVLTNVASKPQNNLSDPGYGYPLGFVDFSAPCSSGIDIILFWYGLDQAQSYILRKFNNITNTYQNIPGVSSGWQLIGGKQVNVFKYTVTDQDNMDENPTRGIIRDPVGVAKISPITNGGSTITISTATKLESGSVQTTQNPILNAQSKSSSINIESSAILNEVGGIKFSNKFYKNIEISELERSNTVRTGGISGKYFWNEILMIVIFTMFIVKFWYRYIFH